MSFHRVNASCTQLQECPRPDRKVEKGQAPRLHEAGPQGWFFCDKRSRKLALWPREGRGGGLAIRPGLCTGNESFLERIDSAGFCTIARSRKTKLRNERPPRLRLAGSPDPGRGKPGGFLGNLPPPREQRTLGKKTLRPPRT